MRASIAQVGFSDFTSRCKQHPPTGSSVASKSQTIIFSKDTEACDEMYGIAFTRDSVLDKTGVQAMVSTSE